MAEKDNMKVNTSPVADVETGTAEDVEAIMKKYDRESNTRVWEGVPKQVIRYLLAAFSLLMLYMNLFANWDERVRRSLFVGVVIILSFLIYPMKKGSTKKNSIPIYDIILMVLGAGAYFYFVINFKTIIGHATRISQTEVIVGVIGILPPRCRYPDPLCSDILYLLRILQRTRTGQRICSRFKICCIQPVLHDRRCHRYSDRCLLDVHRTVYPVRCLP